MSKTTTTAPSYSFSNWREDFKLGFVKKVEYTTAESKKMKARSFSYEVVSAKPEVLIKFFETVIEDHDKDLIEKLEQSYAIRQRLITELNEQAKKYEKVILKIAVVGVLSLVMNIILILAK